MALIAAEQYDPFLKRAVHGNILDQVDNYQYNLKLYMIPPVADPVAQQDQTNESSGSADVRQDKPDSAAGGSQGGYLQNYNVAPPDRTVVLAQTGVTGAQIDNLEIESSVGPGGGVEMSKVNFDIIQPGAADFMDQIISARAHLGMPINAGDCPIFLEIVFKGYGTDISDEDLGGQAILAAGPYRLTLTIGTVSLEIDENGSTYAFSCAPLNRRAYVDTSFTVPKKMESIGTTIPEHVADLIKKINEHNEKNFNDYAIQDKIEIDLSGFTSGKYALKDLSITTSSDKQAETINRIMNPELEGKTEDEYEDILKASSKDEGGLDIVVEENKVTVREGVDIKRYIATLLSMNAEFFSRASRAVKGDDLADTEVKKQQPHIDWFKINGEVKYVAYDNKRNKHATLVTYKPTIYKTASNTTQIKTSENSGLTAEDVRARVDGMPVFKAYHYLYTGLNDQIKQCRIEYKAGAGILAAPAGGMSGDFSTVLAKTNSDSATPTEDLTGNDLATVAVKTANDKDRKDTIDKMFSDEKAPGRENDILKVANTLGFSLKEAKDAVENRDGENARILKESLANRGSAAAIRNAQTAGANKTNNLPDDYTPSLSGYVYSADIIGNVSERLNQQALLNTARSTALESRKAKDDAEDTDASGTSESIVVASVPNEAEDGTYNGTPRNTLFGYLMQQHGATDFLAKLDMEIKGDPWYLGPPSQDSYDERSAAEDSNEETDTDGIRLRGDENYILFDLQTPRRFDMDTTDEDNNTGYWSKMSTAYFISGVYQIVRINHSFSGGEFSQELSTVKMTALDLKKLEKTGTTTNTDEGT